METEGPAPSDGEVGEHPDRLPSENRIGRRTDMEKTKNVRKRGLTPFPLHPTTQGTTGTSVTLYPGTSVTHELFFFVSFVECFWCGREMKAVGLKNPSTPNERLPKCRFA